MQRQTLEILVEIKWIIISKFQSNHPIFFRLKAWLSNTTKLRAETKVKKDIAVLIGKFILRINFIYWRLVTWSINIKCFLKYCSLENIRDLHLLIHHKIIDRGDTIMNLNCFQVSQLSKFQLSNKNSNFVSILKKMMINLSSFKVERVNISYKKGK